MAQKVTLSDVFRSQESHRTVLKVGMVMLLVMEAIIYVVANAHSGSQTWVEIYDSKQDKVYETQGHGLTRYEKLVFETTYGPMKDYRIQTTTHTVPFPFRAWLAVAVGVPIGFVLLSTYLVRTYLSFVNGEEDEDSEDAAFLNGKNAMFGKLSTWRRLSLLNLGALILVCLLALWLVPNFVADIARGFLSLVLRFKWFFLGVTVFFGSLLVWIIYLRYKIAQKMMDRQEEVEKFRLERQLQLEQESRKALTGGTVPRLEAPRDDGGMLEGDYKVRLSADRVARSDSSALDAQTSHVERGGK